ncbi:MAG: hypothetical protein CMH83_12295 [Nocardioides sp.]|nr:hypothetical protein [Nocardioides sp.]
MGYDGPWLWVAVAALAVTALYYAVVLWLGRPERERPAGAGPSRAPAGARRTHLDRLAEVERAVASGTISAREGHQQVSETARSYAAAVAGLPAPRMTLADLRREGPADLADLVALVYPPEFAPEEQPGRDGFPEAVRRARELVERW